MKNTLLLLFLLPLLSFGQSKKDLKARIYSMQLDSTNQAELISDQQKMIVDLQGSVSQSEKEKKEANNELNKVRSDLVVAQHLLELAKDSIIRLKQEIRLQDLKNDLSEIEFNAYIEALSIIEEGKSARELKIRVKNLTLLPPEIGQLLNLKSLDLSWNQLSSIPPEIGQLASLEVLNLRKNELSSLPSEIGQLSNLQKLDLSRNNLISLHPEIGKLSNLTKLELTENELTTLPPEIGQLSNLKFLRLNELATLPPEIGQLSNLKFLDLGGECEYWGKTKLSFLPPEIGQLSNLDSLILDCNELTSFTSGDREGSQILSICDWRIIR